MTETGILHDQLSQLAGDRGILMMQLSSAANLIRRQGLESTAAHFLKTIARMEAEDNLRLKLRELARAQTAEIECRFTRVEEPVSGHPGSAACTQTQEAVGAAEDPFSFESVSRIALRRRQAE